MKSLKTPLRYPGGKSRACVKMDPYFPDLRDYDEFREPFLGCGSVAIHITKKYPNLDIWVNDLYEPLVNFWQQLQMFGIDLKDNLKEIKLANNKPELARDLFLYCKDKLHEKVAQILIVLLIFILSISVLSVVSQRVHHFHHKHPTPTSVCVVLKNCPSILR